MWDRGKNHPSIFKTGSGRGKHNFERREIGHAFAHQTAEWGKTPDGRMYFEKDSGSAGQWERLSTIYSYGSHFPIATLWGKGAERIVTYTTKGYSASTSQHKSYVRDATNHMKRFEVSHPRDPDKAQTDAQNRINDEWTHAKAPLSHRIQGNLDEIARIRKETNEMASAFGLKWRIKKVSVSAKLQARADLLEEREKVRVANFDIRRKELADKRALKDLLAWRASPSQWRIGSSVMMSRHWTPADQTLLDLREANKIELWRAHGGDGYMLSGTYLRRNGDDIETSKGASFPVSHGMKAWPFILSCRDKGQGWQRNGHAVHLGHYQLDSIDAAGNVKAGCHNVPFVEIERIAKELGL